MGVWGWVRGFECCCCVLCVRLCVACCRPATNHHQRTQQQVVNPNAETELIRGTLARLAAAPLAALQQAKAYATPDTGATPAGLAGARARFQSLGATRAMNAHARARILGLFDQASHLARAAEALEGAGHAAALRVAAEARAPGAGRPLQELAAQPLYRQACERLEATAALPHPKMPALADELRRHFRGFEAARAAQEAAGEVDGERAHSNGVSLSLSCPCFASFPLFCTHLHCASLTPLFAPT